MTTLTFLEAVRIPREGFLKEVIRAESQEKNRRHSPGAEEVELGVHPR